MSYTALQFVARGREDGLTMVELAQSTGYDARTSFYVVKVLSELGLV